MGEKKLKPESNLVSRTYLYFEEVESHMRDHTHLEDQFRLFNNTCPCALHTSARSGGWVTQVEKQRDRQSPRSHQLTIAAYASVPAYVLHGAIYQSLFYSSNPPTLSRPVVLKRTGPERQVLMPLTSCVTSAKKTSLTEDASGGTKRMLRAMKKKTLPLCPKTF